MNKIRVLFALGSMGVGGTERQVVEILKHLRRDVFQPSLYLIYRQGELLEQIPDDVPIHSYWDRHQHPRLNYPGRILNAQAQDIARTIDAEQIDVLYDRTSNVTLMTSLAKPKSSVKRISVVVADPRREIDANHAKFAFAKRYLLRRAYRNADRVVTVSEGVREGVVEFYGLTTDQVVTCYNVFDVPRVEGLAENTCPEFDEGRFHVVSVGRLQHEKGQSYLVDAIDELVNRRGLQQLLLWIVGSGPDAVGLQEQVDHRSLDEHVRFEGFQANPMPYLKQADLFCLPSLYEGMPNALVEAMIVKTPVLACDCPSGPREILSDGEFGCLVPPADSHALAAAIENAVADYSAWEGRVITAHRHIEQTFSIKTGMQRIETLLQEVAAHGRK